ncbi:MAG: cupin domain-containing protein [Clostridiales bacterium]|nr:cupin domain-containing protein [Clostridiales bacterium]
MKINQLKDVAPIQLSPNNVMEKLCYDDTGDTYTLNRIVSTKGPGGPLHSHPHRQVDYVVKGQGTFQIGDEKMVIKTGDTVQIEPNEPHTFTWFDEDTVFLEFFTPIREDYKP